MKRQRRVSRVLCVFRRYLFQFVVRSRIGDSVSRSRYVDNWIESGDPGSREINIYRNALSDELVVMYLGFAEASGIDELENSVTELELRIARVENRVLVLTGQVSTGPASPAPTRGSVAERAERQRETNDARQLLAKLEKQLVARKRALPLYQATLDTDGLIDDLRAQRNHPVHTLLRRMYYETRS